MLLYQERLRDQVISNRSTLLRLQIRRPRHVDIQSLGTVATVLKCVR